MFNFPYLAVYGIFYRRLSKVTLYLYIFFDSSTVLIDGEYYHVAYVRENNDIFLLALPHS